MNLRRYIKKHATHIAVIAGALTFFLLAAVAKQDEPLTPFLMMRQSVVRLTLPGQGGGTGFVTTAASGKRVVVTNWHVCEMADPVNQELYADRAGEFEDVKIKIKETDPEHDLCVLDAVPGVALTLGAQPQLFQPLYVLGHPYLRPATPSRGNYDGEIKEKIGFGPNKAGDCMPGDEAFISIFGKSCIREFILGDSNVVIYPGNSGSPIVDDRGSVVGVVNSSDGRTHYAGFIPLRFLNLLLEKH